MKLLLIIFLVLLSHTTMAQVQFKRIGLQEAIKEAATNGKIVMVQFESDKCEQCNVVAEAGLSAKEYSEYINQKCIVIKITTAHPDRERFISLYNPSNGYGTFYISPEGELIHTYLATTSRSAEYVSQVNKALSTLMEGKVTLKELEAEWNNDPANIAAMEINLMKRAALGLATDSLLDVYVKRIPADSMQSIRTLIFIAKLAPNLFSNASLQMRKETLLFNEAWYKIPLPLRIQLNNKAVYKSMEIAIRQKSSGRAQYVARFHAGTHDDRYGLAARKTYDLRILDYYVGVKDTAAYLPLALSYYDKYYMTENAAQLKTKDSLARSKALANVTPVIVSQDGNRRVTTKTYRYAPVNQYLTMALNNGALLIYTSTSNPAMLAKALEWAERANQVFATPESMDTYARLLYKTGNTTQAIEWEGKAIMLRKERNFNAGEFEAILEKMKKGEGLSE